MLEIIAKAKSAIKMFRTRNAKVKKQTKVVTLQETAAKRKLSTALRTKFYSCADINFSIPMSKKPLGAFRNVLQTIIEGLMAIDPQARIFPCATEPEKKCGKCAIEEAHALCHGDRVLKHLFDIQEFSPQGRPKNGAKVLTKMHVCHDKELDKAIEYLRQEWFMCSFSIFTQVLQHYDVVLME